MKKIMLPILLFAATFGYAQEKVSVKPPGFALIELFSSEGCSSCPPAEAVMSMFLYRANAEILPIYIIEFHVDYWDYLGWKDTFATHEYSQRQQDYGDYFKLNSIYTPQAIINGKYEMVGSDEDKINTIISGELKGPSSVIINCKVHKIDNSKVEADYAVTGNISGTQLNFAIIESGLITHIKKGENSGKTLAHENVARVFKTVLLNSATGKIILEIPHVKIANAKLLCYLQNTSNRNITGATQVNLL
jgi:hypothetical protein